MPNKTILITGGAGYIGSHAMLAAKRHGFSPVAFDNLSKGHAWAVKGFPLLRGDLGDTAVIRRAFKKVRPLAVMHFASHINVGESVKDPGKYYRDNLTNAQNLLAVMNETKTRWFILSSTAAVYGDPVKIPMAETHPKNPVNPYGDSKWMLEKILTWHDQAYGLKSTRLRYFNASGADARTRTGEVHEPESHLIPLALDAAMGRRGELTVYGDDYPTPDGTCVRDYIHVEDLAEAHFLALKRMMRTGQSDVFNLGTGRGYSVMEVLRETERATGLKVPYRIGPRREGDPPSLVADSRKAKRVLGWKPEKSDLKHILRSAWAWHQKYFGGKKA